MKHLKSYKVFESISNSELELDVRDMFLELEEEDGYYVGISMRPSGIDMFCVEATRDDLFQWSDVKDYFERAHDYIVENGWDLTKVITSFYTQNTFRKTFEPGDQTEIGMKTEKFLTFNDFRDFVNNSDFIENNMIYEIAFIFDPKKLKWIESNDKLKRKFEFKDFNEALTFINKLAPICESMNHHPEIKWVYNKIELTLSTHDAGDKITELDHQLANKIDKIR
jgi:4a-hydroxytetrahydrobiopterin dehydratase